MRDLRRLFRRGRGSSSPQRVSRGSLVAHLEELLVTGSLRDAAYARVLEHHDLPELTRTVGAAQSALVLAVLVDAGVDDEQRAELMAALASITDADVLDVAIDALLRRSTRSGRAPERGGRYSSGVPVG